MKSREDLLMESTELATPFECMMEGLEEGKGYVERVRAGMPHEQAKAEARAEAEERILARGARARAARQTAERKPTAAKRKPATPRKTTTPAPSPRISARPQ